MDTMWLFSTYLANALGALFNRLPFGNTLLGMNFYTSILVGVLALLGYAFCTRVLKIPSVLAFLGEFVAISLCWCPTVILYNYLTYVFFLLGIVFLYLGLTKESSKHLVFAGVFLGINLFVRLSNLPEAALIVAVWIYGFVCRKKVLQVIKETGWCLLGYLSVVMVMLGFFTIKYGFEEYIAGILRLFGMTENATDYKATSMIRGIITPYIINFYWLKWLLVIVLFGTIVFAVLPGKLEKVKIIGQTLLGIAGICWLYYREFASLIFSDYNAMLLPGILFMMITMGIACIRFFWKNTPKEEKLLSVILVLQLILTSLGSNNGVFPSINNLFIAIPYTLWQTYRLCSLKKRYRIKEDKPFFIYTYPAKLGILLFLILFLFQSIGFGTGFVFVEAAGAKDIAIKVENNPVLEGIYMSEERAIWMSEISEYVSEQDLTGREVLLYGNIPALSFYLQMPPAFNSWSDLRSYSYETMEKDMEKLRNKIESGKEKPVIIVARIERMDQNPKWELIKVFMDDYGYQQTFHNDKFTIFE